MFSKRTRELNAFTGWNGWLSSALEFADVVSPVLSGLASKLSGLVSFFLVGLIGRGLGLIYKGVRQSLALAATPTAKASKPKRKTPTPTDDGTFVGFA